MGNVKTVNKLLFVQSINATELTEGGKIIVDHIFASVYKDQSQFLSTFELYDSDIEMLEVCGVKLDYIE